MSDTPRFVTQTQAAVIYGCTKQCVGQALKFGKPLHAAIRKMGSRTLIDMSNSAAVTWRVGYRTDMKMAPSQPLELAAGTGHKAVEHEEVIRKYWGYTVQRVIEKYGTFAAFSELLKAVDKIESIHMRRLDADRKTGELISRDFVRTHIMGLIERVFQRLLSDLPATLSTEMHSMCETGATKEALETVIHDMLSRELRTVKKDTRGAIRRAKD